MNRFVEKNGPFCNVKRPVLKNRMFFSVDLFGLFTDSDAICFLKRKKKYAGFYGIIY